MLTNKKLKQYIRNTGVGERDLALFEIYNYLSKLVKQKIVKKAVENNK